MPRTPASSLAAALLAATVFVQAAEAGPVQASAKAAAATARPEVDAVTTSYQSWSLRCETRKDPAPAVKICGLLSTVTLKNKDGKPAVATVVMLRSVPRSDVLQLSMELPLGVWLPSGVVLQDAKGAEMVRLPFVACHPDGCEAGQVLTVDQLSALSGAGDQASAVYQLQNQKSVKLSFPMTGFGEGLRALRQAVSQP